jgi:hypothetical protein
MCTNEMRAKETVKVSSGEGLKTNAVKLWSRNGVYHIS